MRSPVLRRTGQSNPISILTFRSGAPEPRVGVDSSKDDDCPSIIILSSSNGDVLISSSENAIKLLGLSLLDFHVVYHASFHSSSSGILVTDIWRDLTR